MQIETKKEERERRKKKKKGKGRGRGRRKEGRVGAVCCRNAPSGDIRRISNCLGNIALPCQLREMWAITLLKMSVDGKMSFDFFENLEGMYSNMQCMREITFKIIWSICK